MKVETINIHAIGGIQSLELTFNASMNIICGPNGVGKSTILDSVEQMFAYGLNTSIKRHISFPSGTIQSTVIHDNIQYEKSFTTTEFKPSSQEHHWPEISHVKYVLYSKTNRTFSYVPLQSVTRDALRTEQSNWLDSRGGITTHDIKNWFVFRFLYSIHENSLTSQQLENFKLAKDCFSALNPNFTFSRVDGSSNDIMINTPSGEIHYEYLSSGFKSCISILFGIIKEIELRFINPNITARDFEGIILIDELEIHLHPEWQSNISAILTTTFPNAQFIVTTHSPHIVQSADQDQIIALEQINGQTTRRVIPNTSNGFKGWTLDEVLTDLMGMNDTRSAYFNNLIYRFGQSIDAEDYVTACLYFKELDESLHPGNQARKLFRLQLASIMGEDHDQA